MNEPIKLDGKYRYRNGEPARVLCVDRNHPIYNVVSLGEQGLPRTHTADGFSYEEIIDSSYDLIPDVPLWEGEIWVKGNECFSEAERVSSVEYLSQDCWRKIKVREAERCQS